MRQALRMDFGPLQGSVFVHELSLRVEATNLLLVIHAIDRDSFRVHCGEVLLTYLGGHSNHRRCSPLFFRTVFVALYLDGSGYSDDNVALPSWLWLY